MEAEKEILLKLTGLRTSYFTRRGELKAVDGVDAQLRRAEIVGIVGESGCGKSALALSLMRLIARPGRIVGGSAEFEGRDLFALSERDMRALRGADIAMVFQEPMTSLNPVRTVGSQIAEAVRAHDSGVGRAAAYARAAEVLEAVGVSDVERRLRSFPHQLSGGLRQRAMIAMALVRRPKLIIADEPTTALDVTVEAQILTLMKRLRDEYGSSIALISHNLGIIAETCDRVYVMYAGKIVEEADVFSLFENPLHPYTAGLLRSLPRPDDTAPPGTRLEAIDGNVPDPLDRGPGCSFAPRCRSVHGACLSAVPELYPAGTGRRVRCFLHQPKEGSPL